MIPRVLAACAAAMLLVSCASKDESGTPAYRLHSSVTLPGLDRPETATVTLTFPETWQVLESSTRRVRLREGTRACHYTITAEATIVQVEASNATDAARSLVPTTNGRILETGKRGSAAWRVVKLRGNGTQVRVSAVRAQPLRFVSQQVGHPTWLATNVHAESDAGDECHSGTYRDTLGPRLGDALATLRSRT